MMRVRERRPEQRIQGQVKAQKEAKLGRVKQGWKASRKGAKERTKRSGIRRRLIFNLRYERYKVQKKRLSAFYVLPADLDSFAISFGARCDFERTSGVL